MRISDWSSDVCSSDLRGDVRLLQLDRVGGRDVDRRRLFEVGVADQRTGDDDFLARCRALYGCVLRIGRRSEEHTSELQSLMRISYAVFCLKKKKKKLV